MFTYVNNEMVDAESGLRVQDWLASGVADIESKHGKELNETAGALLTAAVLVQRGDVDGAVAVVNEVSPHGLGPAIEDVARVMKGENPLLVSLKGNKDVPGEESLRMQDVGEVSPVIIPGQVRNAQIIALEGGDGVGKTLIMRVIERAMYAGLHTTVVNMSNHEPWQEQIAYQTAHGVSVREDCVVIRGGEPGGTQIGIRIRKILLETKDYSRQLNPLTNILLFYADRMQLYAEVNQVFEQYPNSIALMDRCDWSTLVYQRMDFKKGLVEGEKGNADLLVRNVETALSNVNLSFARHVEEQLGRSYPGYVVVLDGDIEELQLRSHLNERHRFTRDNFRDEEKDAVRRELRMLYLQLAAGNRAKCMLVNVHEEFNVVIERILGSILACSPQHLRDSIDAIGWNANSFWLWSQYFNLGSVANHYSRSRGKHTGRNLNNIHNNVYATWSSVGLSVFVPES